MADVAVGLVFRLEEYLVETAGAADAVAAAAAGLPFAPGLGKSGLLLALDALLGFADEAAALV